MRAFLNYWRRVAERALTDTVESLLPKSWEEPLRSGGLALATLAAASWLTGELPIMEEMPGWLAFAVAGAGMYLAWLVVNMARAPYRLECDARAQAAAASAKAEARCQELARTVAEQAEELDGRRRRQEVANCLGRYLERGHEHLLGHPFPQMSDSWAEAAYDWERRLLGEIRRLLPPSEASLFITHYSPPLAISTAQLREEAVTMMRARMGKLRTMVGRHTKSAMGPK